MSAIEDLLRFSAEGIRELNRKHREGFRYLSLYEYVLEEGKLYEAAPLPEEFTKHDNRECFGNAFDLASTHDDLTYVEGYALRLIPIMHAWVTRDGVTAIDPTWDNPEECQYFGVEFPIGLVAASALRNNRYGSVIDDWGSEWPLLRE